LNQGQDVPAMATLVFWCRDVTVLVGDEGTTFLART
jgi:hypothetical protein